MSIGDGSREAYMQHMPWSVPHLIDHVDPELDERVKKVCQRRLSFLGHLDGISGASVNIVVVGRRRSRDEFDPGEMDVN